MAEMNSNQLFIRRIAREDNNQTYRMPENMLVPTKEQCVSTRGYRAVPMKEHSLSEPQEALGPHDHMKIASLTFVRLSCHK